MVSKPDLAFTTARFFDHGDWRAESPRYVTVLLPLLFVVGLCLWGLDGYVAKRQQMRIQEHARLLEVQGMLQACMLDLYRHSEFEDSCSLDLESSEAYVASLIAPRTGVMDYVNGISPPVTGARLRVQVQGILELWHHWKQEIDRISSEASPIGDLLEDLQRHQDHLLMDLRLLDSRLALERQLAIGQLQLARVFVIVVMIFFLVTVIGGFFRDRYHRRRGLSRISSRLMARSLENLAHPVLITTAAPVDAPGPHIIFVNDAFEKITGYRRREVLGKSPRLLQGPLTSVEATQKIRLALETQEAVQVELINYKKDGTPWWVELDIAPVFDDSGVCTHFVAEQRDISDRKLIEHQFDDLLQRSRIIIDNLPAVVGYWDKEQRNVFSNKAYEDWFGREARPQPGMHIRTFMGEALYSAISHHIDAVLAGEKQRFEANYGLKNGTRIQYALTEYIPDWVDGEVAGFYIIAFDITDMKHAKAALAAGEDKLDGLFKLSRLGIVLNDMQGRFLEFNHAFTKLTGYSADTLRKLDYWTLTPGDYQDQETVQLDLLKEHGHYGPYEKEYLRADGVRIPVLLNGVLIHDANDQPLIWSIVEDITERKAMDSELRKAKESAENLAVAKSDFLANMSHEIRTPMNAISGLCQLALNLDVSSEVRDYLEKMAGASRGLLEILNDVLDFSKLESGKFHIKSDPFRLDELLGEINDIFVEVAARKKLSFHVRTDSSTPVALIGDAGRLRQIIANLVSNAIKFTTDGRVTLSVAPLSNTGDRAVIRFKVSDSGIGIAEEDIPKLFDPFIQVEAAHRNANGGTGLGLAISSELLALMGSHFDVSSIIGLGSSFSFDLDLLQNRSRAPSTGDAGQIQGNSRNTRAGELKMELEQIGSDIRGKRILIAEDNVISQMLMREFLAFAQLRVELAGDGVEALAALDRNTYDAVLMDMHMPRMGGIEATRQIRMNPRYRQLPVIALSAGVTEEEREICLEAGVDAFIAKPVDPKALLQVLIRLIKK